MFCLLFFSSRTTSKLYFHGTKVKTTLVCQMLKILVDTLIKTILLRTYYNSFHNFSVLPSRKEASERDCVTQCTLTFMVNNSSVELGFIDFWRLHTLGTANGSCCLQTRLPTQGHRIIKIINCDYGYNM